ncbi:hypothetical protein LJR034_008475 [Caballeronia sp. LjRoot34]|uniref:hypothetical protein n=1 Tax=Caballeronia sp. LjRoot34 TaxID=3342325 RepID=UPI003ED1698E
MNPPEACVICEEERQFVLPAGQSWTTLPKLSQSHQITFRDDAGLLGIGTSPSFAIGQRALLVRSPHGNVLWDCVSLVNDTMVELLNGLGGVQAIAISHPHYYATMVEWSRAFGDIPVYLHAADQQWVMHRDSCIEYWDGNTKEIAPGLTLLRAGGHFEGGTVMHWAQGAGGKGALLSGDILQVVADRKHLGFMRSYPNFIPLGVKAVQQIADRIKPWHFDAVYGAFWDRVIAKNGEHAFDASVRRHIEWLERDAL